jgi:phosphatidylinositol-bisphosphatase
MLFQLSLAPLTRSFIIGGGFSGNKGGTALRLYYRDSCLTFVNSHLAAHAEMSDRRNADFHEIANRMTFPRPSKNDMSELELETENDKVAPESLTLYDGHHLFWCGDINYRISLPAAQVRTHIAHREWDQLWPHDQVRRLFFLQIVVFSKKKPDEGGISDSSSRCEDLDWPLKTSFHLSRLFRLRIVSKSAPMFTILGTLLELILVQLFLVWYIHSRTCPNRNDNRSPSWTDRILWLSKPPEDVEQLSYDCHSELMDSDHKPVTALFNVKVSARIVLSVELN